MGEREAFARGWGDRRVADAFKFKKVKKSKSKNGIRCWAGFAVRVCCGGQGARGMLIALRAGAFSVSVGLARRSQFVDCPPVARVNLE